MVYARIAGTGSYIPTYRVLTNQDLEKMLKEAYPHEPGKWTSDEWITQRTGIKERRIAGPDETNATMGAKALKAALDDARIAPAELDMIIVATNTNERNFPSCCGAIQAGVGAQCGFFDVQAGCTGFTYALAIADSFIRSGMYRRVAVVGTDKLSGITDYRDRETCVLFGDMACAWILQQSDEPGLLRHVLGGNGRDRDKIGLTSPDIKRLCERQQGIQGSPIYTTGQGYLYMNGRDVFRFATTVLPQACTEVLEGTSYTITDVKRIFPHNANLRIIESAAERLADRLRLQPEEVREKFYHNIDRYGNASAASNANSFHEARTKGILKPGDLAILAGFGAGLTWGATALIY